MGRRFGLAPPNDVIWGLADTIFSEVYFVCVCVHIRNELVWQHGIL